MKKRIATLLALLLACLCACGAPAEQPASETPEQTGQTQAAENDNPAAPDFALTDQYGREHRLSEYKGKIVLLNFWATWCPYCIREIPDLQKLYVSETEKEEPEVIVLGIAAPEQSGEADAAGIADFLAENGYSYPTLMDTEGDVFRTYGASALPATFVIGRDGSVCGYVPGALSEEMLQRIVDQALEKA